MTRKNKNSTSTVQAKYASYTYDSPNFLIRFPHRKRNKLVASEISALNSMSWLDYGAGDGALLKNLSTCHQLPKNIILFEPDQFMQTQLISQVSSTGVDSVKILSAYEDVFKNQYDLVTILEVLEHLPLPERFRFYNLLATNLSIDGKVLIEIPVEYGPILLIKELGRKFLKRRHTDYTFGELLGAFFGRIKDSNYRYLIDDTRSFISPHRGFDLKRLLAELERIGKIKEIAKSPFPFFPKSFNQTVLYIFELKERDPEKIRKLVMTTD
jgi:phospholipid N-methyltransferase